MSDGFQKIPAIDFDSIKRVNTNQYKKLALTFLEQCSDYIFCTSRDETRKGTFYRYCEGLYSPISVIDLENHIESIIPEADRLPRQRVLEVISNLKSKRYCYFDQFNQQDLINFRNGYFHVTNRSITPHSPEILSTVQLPYDYDPDARCPMWEESILRITDGDMEKVHVLQEFMGYCFTRSTKFEKSLFLIGEANSGKSTVVTMFEALLGQHNISAVSLRHMMNPNFMGSLIGAYANLVTEIPKNISDYEDVFKTIVSGEPITVNTKYIPTYTARPFCKLVFAGNKLMHIADTSNAVFRRMLLLELNNVIPPSEVDVDWKQKLLVEAPGIFNWALDGLDRLNANKAFTSCTEMELRLKEVKIANNSALFFCEERVTTSLNKSDSFITKKDLYDEYRKFCLEYNIKGVISMKNFNEEIFSIYRPRVMRDQRKSVDGKQVRVWGGLKMRDRFERSEEMIEWEN